MLETKSYFTDCCDVVSYKESEKLPFIFTKLSLDTVFHVHVLDGEINNCMILFNEEVVLVEAFDVEYQKSRQFGDDISLSFTSNQILKKINK
jgi:hypothetical protein